VVGSQAIAFVEIVCYNELSQVRWRFSVEGLVRASAVHVRLNACLGFRGGSQPYDSVAKRRIVGSRLCNLGIVLCQRLTDWFHLGLRSCQCGT